nr:hypothetical protein [Bat mastadenovirus BtSY2]
MSAVFKCPSARLMPVAGSFSKSCSLSTRWGSWNLRSVRPLSKRACRAPSPSSPSRSRNRFSAGTYASAASRLSCTRGCVSGATGADPPLRRAKPSLSPSKRSAAGGEGRIWRSTGCICGHTAELSLFCIRAERPGLC